MRKKQEINDEINLLKMKKKEILSNDEYSSKKMQEETLKVEEKIELLKWVLNPDVSSFNAVLSLDDKLNQTTKEETLHIKNGGESLSIVPSSTTYLFAEQKFGVPFCIQMNDYDLSETVAMSLSIENAKKIANFFVSKIEEINKLK